MGVVWHGGEGGWVHKELIVRKFMGWFLKNCLAQAVSPSGVKDVMMDTAFVSESLVATDVLQRSAVSDGAVVGTDMPDAAGFGVAWDENRGQAAIAERGLRPCMLTEPQMTTAEPLVQSPAEFRR